jgi:hypothetical protein
MLRRDYILRMIEEFVRAIARMKSLKDERKYDEASLSVAEQFEKLAGTDLASATRLSDTVLLAKLIDTEPSQSMRDKSLMAARLFFEGGELAAAKGEESRDFYLKGLHVLLHTFRQNEVAELPEFVPTIERFVEVLGDEPLPLQTLGLLMEHYERSGQFAKAEDALFTMLEGEPDNEPLLRFAEAFYRRLEGQTDLALHRGNLSRAEVLESAAEVQKRKIKP